MTLLFPQVRPYANPISKNTVVKPTVPAKRKKKEVAYQTVSTKPIFGYSFK